MSFQTWYSKSEGYVTIFNAIISFFCFIPLIMYYGCKYYKKRGWVVLKQRYASIVVVEIVCTCSIVSVVNITMIIIVFCKMTTYLVYGILLIQLINAIAQILLISCWVMRFWMILVTMKHEIVISSVQWMHILNSQSIHMVKHKWYLDKIHIFGNLRWIVYHFLLPWTIFWTLVYVILFYIIQILYNDTYRKMVGYPFPFVAVFLYSYYWIPFILLIILYWKLPKFQDHFFISLELKRLIILCLIAILFLIFVATIQNVNVISIFLVIAQTVYPAYFTLISLTTTWWVLKKLNSIEITFDADTNDDQTRRMNGSVSFPLISRNCNTKYDRMRETQLKQMLSDTDYFQVYIDHLSKELSIKFLLAFVEIIQLQQYIMQQNMDNIDAKFQQSLFQTITFYDGIPRSLIVSDNDEDNAEEKYEQPLLTSIKSKSSQLFKKYIEYGSKYEVLLTEQTRNEVGDVMSHIDWIEDDEYNINTVLELWNDVSKELFILLLDAFSRFQTTLQYQNLKLQRLY
eukprot:307176_1